LHDISHLKAVERMKDEFISTVSHELRTPITAIVLLTEALNKYYDRMTPEQILKRVGQLRTQSNVLSEMVESILDVSRMEMHGRQNSMRPVNLSNVVRDIVGELQPSALAREQTIEFAINNETAVIVRGEQMDFARIWRNLINNAIKYTPEGGDIYIRMERFHNSGVVEPTPPRLACWSSVLTMLDMTHHDYVVGQVEDTGYGIRPEDFGGLFKRFDRGWAKESNIPGTGLGLPMVRELLATYGGDIHVSSELNQGSIFTFWIPVEDEVNL
jgi:two-component system phosphate regulon sensor histidine kinase PhoR